jgi:hypothetical protein
LFYDDFGYSRIGHYFVASSTISISACVKLYAISLTLGGLPVFP